MRHFTFKLDANKANKVNKGSAPSYSNNVISINPTYAFVVKWTPNSKPKSVRSLVRKVIFYGGVVATLTAVAARIINFKLNCLVLKPCVVMK